MSSLPLAGVTPSHRPGRTTLLVVAVWAAAAAGAAIGVVRLADDGTATRAASAPVPPPPAPEQAPAGMTPQVGDRVKMSFGAASVGAVMRIVGPDAVLGMDVSRGERAYQLHLTVVNLRDRPVTFDPAGISLRPRGAVGDVQIATGSADGGRIDAMSPHRFAIRFVSSATAALPELRLRDPGSGRVHTIALGATKGLETLDVGAHHGSATATGGRDR